MSRSFWLLLLFITIISALGYWQINRVDEVLQTEFIAQTSSRNDNLKPNDAFVDEEFERYLMGHKFLVSRNFDKLHEHIREYYYRFNNGELESWHVNRMLSGIALPIPDDEEIYNAFVSQFPKSAYSYLLRGEYYRSLGFAERGSGWARQTKAEQFSAMKKRHHLAISDFQRAIALQEDLMHAHASLIQIFGTRSNVIDKSRLEDLLRKKEVFELEPIKYAKELKNLLIELNEIVSIPPKVEDFYNAFDEARRINSSSFDVWSSYFYAMRPRWGGSYEDMDEGVELMRPHYIKNENLQSLRWSKLWDQVSILVKKEQYDEAIKLIKQPLAERDYTQGHYWTGRIHHRQRRYASAISSYSKALVLNPLGSDIYKNRSYAYVHQKRYDLAMKDIEKLERLLGYGYEVVCATAFVKERNYKTWRDSIPLYEECLSLKPRYKSRSYELKTLAKLKERISHEDYHRGDSINYVGKVIPDFAKFTTETWLNNMTDYGRMNISEAELEETFKQFRHLGKLLKFDSPFLVRVARESQCDEGEYYPVRYQSDMQFEKGKARLFLDVCKQDGEFKASTFVFYHD